MPTMRDVADAAGVSAKTVSRVFNNDPHVTPETRARVEHAMRDMNYVPNGLATTFRAGRTNVIAVAVPDIIDPFFAAIAHEVEVVAATRGCSTLVTSLGDDPDREREILESVLSRQLSGLIIAPIATDHAWLERWRAHTPLVFVDRLPENITADSFTEDDIEGARMATSHLIERGHTRIAFVGDDLHGPSTGRRLDGYRAALQDAGLQFDPALVTVSVSDRASASDLVDKLWQLRPRPTATFTANARVSMAVYPALRRHRSAIVGFGDFPMADALTPPLSVVAQDPSTLGSLAATRVLDRLETPQRRFRTKKVLPLHLIDRGSSEPPAGVVRTRRPAAS